jgi:predicted N-acetyltransferase YhbS
MSITGVRPDDHPVESGTRAAAHRAAADPSGPKEFRLRLATESDVPAIVALLAEAFKDGDPVSEWIFPDERKRLRGQRRMLAALVRHRHLPVGSAEVAVSGDEIVGVSLFQRSWRKPSLVQRTIGDLALLRVLRSRVFAAIAVDAALHAAAPKVRHICLVHLACEPSWARTGVGTALFMSLFAKSVEVGGAFYGVMKPANFTYYTSILQGLGVQDESIAGEVTIGRRGPTLKTLWGQPHY